MNIVTGLGASDQNSSWQDPLGLYGGQAPGISDQSQAAPDPQPAPQQQTAPSWATDPRDENDVINTVIGEAAGEGDKGMAAVAAVIKNRAASRGLSPADVVRQPSQFTAYTAPGAQVKKDESDPSLRARAASIVNSVFDGSTPDPTGGADHYHADSVTPDWASTMPQTARIGSQVFYKSNEGKSASRGKSSSPPVEAYSGDFKDGLGLYGGSDPFSAVLKQPDQGSQADQPQQQQQPAQAPEVDDNAAGKFLLTKLQPGKPASYISNMKPDLRDGLTAMMQEAPDDVKNGLQILSGARTPDRQAQIIAENADKYGIDKEAWLSDVAAYGPVGAGQRWRPAFRDSGMSKFIAAPGGSQHQKGEAADLGWNGGTLSSAPKPVVDWLHQNASKYGLVFPLSNEAWHVEAAGARGGKNDLPPPSPDATAQTTDPASPEQTLTVDRGFHAQDPMNMYPDGNPIQQAADTQFAKQDSDAASMAQQTEQNRMTGFAQQHNADAQASAQSLNASDPNAWEALSPQDAEKRKQQWDAENKSSGILGDTGRMLAAGNAELGLQVRAAVGMIPGIGPKIVSTIDGIDQWATGKPVEQRLKDYTETANASVTDAQQNADSKTWWDSKKNWFGPAWSDPRSYLRVTAESAPSTLVTMAPGGILAKGSYLRAIAAGMSEREAAAAAATTATLAGGFSEGVIAGGDSANNVRDKIAAIPRDQLVQSDAVQSLVKGGMSEDQAIYSVTNDAATQAFLLTGITTGMFGGMGDRALAKIIAEGVGGGVTRRIAEGMARGFVGEGVLEEAPQNVTQQISENAAVQRVDPNQSLTEGVGEALASGIAGGGAMGAGMGGAGGAVSRAHGHEASEEQQAEEPTPAPAAAPVTPQPAPKGPMGRAVQYANDQTAKRAAPKFTIDDGPIGNTPAGPMNGQTVSLAPDQGSVPASMRRVVTSDGKEAVIGNNLLKPLDKPTPAKPAVPDGMPEVGATVRVDHEGVEPFMARIDGYDGNEAVVIDSGSGEIYQVPVTSINQIAPSPETAQRAAEQKATPTGDTLPESSNDPALEPLAPVASQTTSEGLPPSKEQKPATERFPDRPAPGESIIVDNKYGGRFPAKVKSWENDGKEAVVVDNDGNERQVAVGDLYVNKLTPKQVEDQDIERNPPVEREVGDAGPNSRRVFGKTVVLPDELHARLYDVGKDRFISKKAGGNSQLDLDQVNNPEIKKLAKDFGVSAIDLGSMADDYRYRVDRNAQQARTQLPVKMAEVNDRLLKRMQSSQKGAPDPEDFGHWWDVDLNEVQRKNILQQAGVQRSEKVGWGGFTPNIQKKLAAMRVGENAEGIQPTADSEAPIADAVAAKPDTEVANADPTPEITKEPPKGMEPVEVYHGTLGDFDRFDKNLLGKETGANSAKQAFFFSSDPRVSEGYAKGYNPYKESILARFIPGGKFGALYTKLNEAVLKILRGRGAIEPDGNILRTRLRLDNPLVYDAQGRELRDRERTDVIDKAKAEGHDGVVFRNSRDPGYTDESDIPSDVYAVFDPDKIDILSKHKDAASAAKAREQFASKGQSDPDLFSLDDAAHRAATSPQNELPEPTPAQKEAIRDSLQSFLRENTLEEGATAAGGKNIMGVTINSPDREAAFMAGVDDALSGAKPRRMADRASQILYDIAVAKANASIDQLGSKEESERDLFSTDDAAHQAATSPQNDLPEPTAAQKEAGNYQKGHVRLGGLDLSIENPAGSERSGTDASGKPWSVEMKSHYGYIKGTIGKDKDHIDVFVKPGTDQLDDAAPVFVVDQKHGNRFDEHKVMLGFDSRDEAQKAYLANYSKGWDGMGQVTEASLGDFKDWLKSGQTSAPYSNYAAKQPAVAEKAAEPEVDKYQKVKDLFRDQPIKDLADTSLPKEVFHGTSQGGFHQFDPYRGDYGLMGSGSYFTENPNIAVDYTKKGKGKNPTLYSAKLSIKNALNMDAPADVNAWLKAFADYVSDEDVFGNPVSYKGYTNEQMYREVEEALSQEMIPKYEGAEIMQDGVRSMGHDGITHIGGGRVKNDSTKHRVWIAFDPEQVEMGGRWPVDGNNAPAAPEAKLTAEKAAPVSAEKGVEPAPAKTADKRVDPKLKGTTNNMAALVPPTPVAGKPVGEWAADHVLSIGRKSGHEYLLAVDDDGSPVLYGTGGRRTDTGLNDASLSAMANPERNLVVYHNHPANGPLSAPDIGMLALPGIHAIYSIGHGGRDMRAALTTSAREHLRENAAESVAAIDATRSAIANAREEANDVLDKEFDAGRITEDQAKEAYDNLPSLLAERANIIDFSSNVQYDPTTIAGLDQRISDVAQKLAKDFYNDPSATIRGSGVRRSSIPVGHVADLEELGERRELLEGGRSAAPGLSEGSSPDYRPKKQNGGKIADDEVLPSVSESTIVDKVSQTLQGKSTDLQPVLLKTVPLNYFPELAGGKIPAIEEYLGVKRAMDAYRGKRHDESVKIIDQWRKLISKGYFLTDQSRASQIADLMHETTLAGVDPSLTTEEERAKPGYAELRKRFVALPPMAKDLYSTVRDSYRKQADDTDALLLDNVRKAQQIALNRAEAAYKAKIEDINSSDVKEPDRRNAIEDAESQYKADSTKAKWAAKARLTKLRLSFENSRVEAPYFPLARFGRYFVSAKDIDGKVLHFSRHEQQADQRQALDGLKRALPNAQIDSGVLEESGDLRRAMDPRVVAEIETLLGDAGVDDTIRDALWQRFLETMPDLSMRKNFIHRKGTPGYNRDAFRVFASNQFHSAHQMARLKYGLELQELVNDAADQAKAIKNNNREMTLVNEFINRDKWVRNPTGGSFTNWVTSAAFVWYLAASPASSMVNATQTIMMGVPLLGSKFGIGKSTAALTRAMGDFISGRADVRRAKLTSDEKAAMNAFYDSGLIDRTQSHDLAAIGDTGTKYNPIRSKVMNAMSWGFHNVELMNREITALAAYRLAREAGQGHLQAINTAHERTYSIHFDLSNSSRPAVLQGDFAKTALVFRAFQINMLYRLARDLHQSFKGVTPAARTEARMQFAGVVGMMGLFAGVTGVPGYGLAMAAAHIFSSIFGDDDDDPVDPEDQFKNSVRAALGPELGDILLKGAPGHYLGVDLTSRVGMPDLWFRSPNKDLQGREEWQYYVLNSLGASVSMIGDMFEGFHVATDENNVARGIETAAPKAVRDLMKSWRYAWEGVTDLGGNEVISRDELSNYELASQFMGFTPAKIAETYEHNSALKNAEQNVMDRRRSIVNAFAQAVTLGDDEAKKAALDRVKTFNRNPTNRTVAITGNTLKQSLKTRAKNKAERKDGVLIQNKKLGAQLQSALPTGDD